MADNNPTLRKTLARQAAGIFGFQFTSTLEVAGVNAPACLGQCDESDKLEIAGRDKVRALNAAILTANMLTVPATMSPGQIYLLIEAKVKVGQAVVLDGDPRWQVFRFFVSADGAVVTFVLMDAG